MVDIIDRVARIEAEVERLKPTLAERLAKLETANTQKTERPRAGLAGFVSWMGAEAPKLIAAAVLLLVTYWIKDSVDIAVSRQQLQLSFIKEMQSQMEKMADPKSDDKEIERAALMMAAFGQPAIIPLLNETRYGDLRANGAEAGLRYLALVDPQSLCRVLPRVLVNRTRQFGWTSHLRVIRLLGESGCTDARSELKQYRDEIKSARTSAANSAYYDLVADHPKPDEFDQLERALERSLSLLARG